MILLVDFMPSGASDDCELGAPSVTGNTRMYLWGGVRATVLTCER
jgi:hypothetical protein